MRNKIYMDVYNNYVISRDFQLGVCALDKIVDGRVLQTLSEIKLRFLSVSILQTHFIRTIYILCYILVYTWC